MPDKLILGNGGGGSLVNHHKAPALQVPDGLLHGGLGEPAAFGELAQAEGGPPVPEAKQAAPDDQIDEKGIGRAVMTGQIRQQDIQHVSVDLDMVHCTIA